MILMSVSAPGAEGAEGQLGSMAVGNTMMVPPLADSAQVESRYQFCTIVTATGTLVSYPVPLTRRAHSMASQ
jgi:hypothetical protein